MKLLIVSYVDPWVRSVSTVDKYVAAGRKLGHDIAVFGTPKEDLPSVTFTTDTSGVDLALFVIQVNQDFPDMPHLARLLDSVPREKRIVADLWGRYNDTIRLEHDFNHLEKIDGHLGWEWEDAFRAVSGTILQPTPTPLRSDIGSFLFHGYDPDAVDRNYASADEAAAAWRSASMEDKPYGVVYVGSNWQRWNQMRRFLEGYAPARDKVGQACLIGWDWGERPEWAIENGVAGIDTDPDFLRELNVDVYDGSRFDDVTDLLGKGKFVPVIHRPLFRHLGMVTIRTFETFYADSLPVLMLPRDFAETIYGPAAVTLVPGENLADHMTDALENPEKYWDAVLKTRDYLARHHSFGKRLEELGQYMNGGSQAQVTG
ncbi:MAG: hypothetical protein KTR19_07140 [Hyphomicrobiales bacterium]|nr:hypothetical protein [Hyphomicrobiales bacterium]